MPIPVITNFSINDTKPLDDRLVVTSSTAMNAILYKYEGLTVYRTDTKKNYQYDGTTWNVIASGIYGGNGSLPNDVIVDTTTDNSIRDYNQFGQAGEQGFAHLGLFLSASASSANRSYVKNFFNTKDSSLLSTSLEYVMVFQKDSGIDTTLYSGFKLNSPDALGTTNGGAVSIWTSPLSASSGQSALRFQVEGNGTIRFKPIASLSSFFNITGSSDNTVTIGYNYEGSTRSITNKAGSFIQFQDEKITFGGILSTGSPFTNLILRNTEIAPQINLVMGGSSVYMGFGSGGLKSGSESSVSPTQVASFSPYIALTWRSGGTYIDLFRYFQNTTVQSSLPNSHYIRFDKDVNIGKATIFSVNETAPNITGSFPTFTTYGPLNARYYTNLWDNKFVSDGDDNSWAYQDSDSTNSQETIDWTTHNNNSVSVVQEEYSGQGQDFYFQIVPRNYTATYVSTSIWELSSQPYDRMMYFHIDHRDGANPAVNLAHQLTWYLTDEAPLTGSGTRRWKKIGKIETGNKNNQNMGTVTASYPYYSQQCLLPANMYMKLVFKFPYAFSGLITMTYPSENNYETWRRNLPMLVMTCIRSGIFKKNRESGASIEWNSNKDWLKNDTIGGGGGGP